ncbi:MAG TPA: hypothetical protein VFL41_05995 [Gaiellaceae bacterium]|nr:hypothetical protein [Gaiellaceae bacterium]
MQVTHREELEARHVTAWRRDQLVGAGSPLPLASKVAHDSRYDVHALIELTERGCPPELAVRILAPLEDDAAA